ncbi:HAD family hydrolase [Enterococcus faecium]|uniref:HAD family hydrolase n=3 Tax=Enterococcus faecium TaxID=1352 RepID=UPI001EE8DB34|nr:HAD family hydrolase [Enterococcus faecium]
MEEFGIDSISRTEALDFQADYEYELDQITMIPEIHQLLLALHKNRIPIGILTNGPVDLQSRKLQNIGAYQYFEKQNIIISQSTHGGAAENSYEGNVKNLQSYQNVQLSKRAIEILKEEIELNHQHIRFNPDYKDNGWIFTSKSRHKPGMATFFLTNFIRCRTSFRMLFRLSLTMSLLGCDDLRQELTVKVRLPR